MLFKEFAGVDAFPICLDTKDPERDHRRPSISIAPGVRRHQPRGHQRAALLRDRGAPEGRARHPGLPRRPARHRGRHARRADERRQAHRQGARGPQGPDRRPRRRRASPSRRSCCEPASRTIVGCDSRGAVHTDRADYLDGSMPPIKRWFAEATNPDKRAGGPADVIDGADLFVGLSGARVMPAGGAGADEPRRDGLRDGQPEPGGHARGGRALRARSSPPAARTTRTRSTTSSASPASSAARSTSAPATITEEMKMAAARGIAAIVADDELREDYIIPSVFNRDVADAVAAAVADEAKAPGRGRRARSATPQIDAELAPADPRREPSFDAGHAPERRYTGHAHHDHRSERAASAAALRRTAARAARRRGHRASRAGRRLGPRRRARRRPRRSPAATRSSTWPASTSPSAGATRRARRSATRARRARATSSRASGGRPAADGADQLLRRRLLRPARRRARSTRTRPPGDDFLAEVCVAWEREADSGRGARAARRQGPHRRRARRRTAARWRRCCRRSSSASAARSPAASSTCRGSTSTTSSGSTCAALDDAAWSGAGQRHARPSRSPTRRSRKALGQALHRPAVAPVPALAIRLLYGDMAEIVTKGQRVDPAPHARARLHASSTPTSTRPCAAAVAVSG